MRKTISILAVTVGIALVLFTLLVFILQLPTKIDANPAWEESVSGDNVTRDQFRVYHWGTELETEIILPAGGAAQKAAVIFVTGAGANIFQNYDGFLESYIQDVFLPRDIAVVYFNKRGMGTSGGNWLGSGIQRRANDVEAVAKALQENPAIDPARIGAVGHGQGGVVATKVAADRDNIVFFMSLMGPTTTSYDQFLAEQKQAQICQGLTGDALDDAMAAIEKKSSFRTRIGGLVKVGTYGHEAKMLEYNPTEPIQSLSKPGLFIFAQHDALVPAAQNMAQLKTIFPAGVPDNFSSIQIAGINHLGFAVDEICTPLVETAYGTASADLVAGMNDWLAANGY